jgi:hemophore-related protein
MQQHVRSMTMSYRRAAVVIGATVCAGWITSVAPAAADIPPNCTGGDYAGVTAGVAAAMSSYLFTHPEVNDAITGFEQLPRDRSAVALVDYQQAHPQVRAEMAGIRQPIVDFEVRCGYADKADLS